ncbi:MAG TPA: hypothetical protein VFL47_07265 [Flavisolibacter sp.]|nr:hypothetical protein [Flavisolibacter sp.]
MKKKAVNRQLLQLLVSVYNQSIQTYFYFPDVILCGHLHLEVEDFSQLLAEGYIAPYKADSFGRFFRLTKKGESFLFQFTFRRRVKHAALFSAVQKQFQFVV